MTDEPGLQVGDLLDGKYEIVGVLGAGAMGVVYSAFHRKLNRNVAIKTLRANFADSHEALTRFEREAMAAGSLRHKNIAEIFDAGVTAEGVHYLVLELLDGKNLFQKIKASERISVKSAIALVAQVLEGLSAAHARGIIHRDLKPENIIVVKDDNGQPLAKILDFGISKIVESDGAPTGPRATQLGTTVGTPRYMSREQIRGSKKLDHRTDLWSTGVLLYELVCGVGPFNQPEVLAVMSAVLEHRFEPPRSHRKDISPQLEAVISKAMSSDPKDRFPDAKAMREALLALPEAGGKRRLQMPNTLPAPVEGQPDAPRVDAPIAPTVAATPVVRGPAASAAAPAPPPAPTSPATEPEYASGLSAAQGGATQNEQEMLAALDRMGVGSPQAPVAAAPPSSDATRQLEAQLDLGQLSAAPKVPSLDLGPVVKHAEPKPVASPKPASVSNDAFAPPEEAKPMALTIERVPAAAPRASGASGASGARAPRGRSSPRGTMAAPQKFRLSSVLIPIVLVGLVAAGGGLLFRYYKLGYWFTPPKSDVVNVRFSVDPPEAEITVNGTLVTSFPFVGTAGETYRLVFAAPGRIAVMQVITPGIGDTPGLRARLHHKLPLLGGDREPVTLPRIADEPSLATLDSAMSKIARYRRCFDATVDAVSESERAYTSSTRSGVSVKSLPVVTTLPKADVAACRAAVEVASKKDPALTQLDPATAAYVDAVEQAGQLLTDLDRYYKTADFKSDNLKMGRARHRDMKARLAAAVSTSKAMRVALGASERLWSWKELAIIDATEGASDHTKLRRLVLVARSYAAASAQKAPKKDRVELLAALQRSLKQVEELVANPDGSTEGAQSMVNLIKPLAKSNPEAPVRHYNQAVTRFNGFIVNKRRAAPAQ